MENALLKFTNETFRKIEDRTVSLRNMSVHDLKDYLTDLQLYKPELTLHMTGFKERLRVKSQSKGDLQIHPKSQNQSIQSYKLVVGDHYRGNVLNNSNSKTPN